MRTIAFFICFIVVAQAPAGVCGQRLVLMSEYFEHAGAFPPPNWTAQSAAAGPDWSLAGNSSDYWARCDGHTSSDPMDERLISSTVNCTGYTGGLKLKWWNYYRTVPSGSTSYGYVEVSTDGGGVWQTLKTYSTSTVALNPDSAFVPQAANQAQVKFRWRYLAPDFHRYSWEIDDVVFEAGVAHDVGVDSLMGPSSNDKVRAGAEVKVWALVRNYTGNAETNVQVTCSSNPGSYASIVTIPSLAGDASAMVNFPTLWTVPASGSYALTATTSLSGDGDASNDAASATGIAPVGFAAANSVLLNWQDTTERDAYIAALAAGGIGYDNWDRAWGNLYGLEAWTTVIFAEESGLYPASAEQISMMRYLDEGTAASGKKHLLLSGDNIGYYSSIGVLSDQFFENYLHATCDGDNVSPAGNETYTAAPCTYIGGADETDEISVNQFFDDEIGADAAAETLYAWQWFPVVIPVAIQYASPAREHVLLGFGMAELTVASQRNALMSRILQWFDGPPPPAGMGAVTVSSAAANVTLSWAVDPSWVCPAFRVYRATSAFFTPGAPYAETGDASFIDAGAAGNPAINYFYRVAPVDFGVQGSASPPVGVFDYEIEYPFDGGRR